MDNLDHSDLIFYFNQIGWINQLLLAIAFCLLGVYSMFLQAFFFLCSSFISFLLPFEGFLLLGKFKFCLGFIHFWGTGYFVTVYRDTLLLNDSLVYAVSGEF